MLQLILMDLKILISICVFLVRYSECVRCLNCNGVVSPLLCDRLEQCAKDEVCLTEKYLTANQEELFNLGCFSKNSCSNSSADHQSGNSYIFSHLNQADKLECAMCCNSDACNQNPCGQNNTDFMRGPLCYTCHQTKDPSLCSFVTSCEPNQVCRMEEISFAGLTVYTSSCSAKSNCHRHIGTAFGRRKRSTYSNITCCDGDLCNDGKPKDTIVKNPVDCMDIQSDDPSVTSGVFTIYPDGKNPHNVFCDMITDGGGWTVLTFRNASISSNWNMTWTTYKNGFGDIHGNHWIGNEYIYLLTANRSVELYVKLQAHNSTWYYARYSYFSIGPESDGYRIHVDHSNYKGNAGDGFWDHGSSNLNGKQFTTPDRNNGNLCSSSFGCGWWFAACFNAALTVDHPYKWQADLGGDELKASYMMLRQIAKNR